jgi:hypothetical protein
MRLDVQLFICIYIYKTISLCTYIHISMSIFTYEYIYANVCMKIYLCVFLHNLYMHKWAIRWVGGLKLSMNDRIYVSISIYIYI